MPKPQQIPRTKFWRPAGELLLVELIPFTYNLAKNTDFSHVSFKSIGDNLSISNWEFDVDKFLTNQFAHPYHGNLYFNTFRSTGHTFWQSAPAAFCGSLLWEIAGENTYPSYNDLINTTVGGITLGEMTHRFAGLLINKKRRGARRQVQEVLATLINPVDGFNRIVGGEWGKQYATDAEDSLYVDFTVDAGIRRVNKEPNELFKSGRNEVYSSLRLRYGNPFKDYRSPFDNFYIFMEVGGADSALLNSLWVQGSLWGKLTGGGDKSIKMLRLTLNYDFYKNTAFEYGGQSLLLTWAAHFNPGKRWQVNVEAGGGAILIGASPDRYRNYHDARDYTYGSGATFLAIGDVIYNNRLYCRVNFRSGWTGTIDGSTTSTALHLINTEIKYRFFGNFTISGSWGNFQLLSFYPRIPTTNEKYPFSRLSLGYKVIL